jgi:hypothetical protein
MDGIAVLFKDDYMLSEILLFLPPQPMFLVFRFREDFRIF